MNTRTRKSFASFAMAMLACYTLSSAAVAYAQTSNLPNNIDVQGQDQSQNLGAVNNVAKTIISFCLNVVARVVGVGIAIWAIMDFVKRDVLWGTVKLFLCGVCFFLNNIIGAMARMGGAAT